MRNLTELQPLKFSMNGSSMQLLCPIKIHFCVVLTPYYNKNDKLSMKKGRLKMSISTLRRHATLALVYFPGRGLSTQSRNNRRRKVHTWKRFILLSRSTSPELLISILKLSASEQSHFYLSYPNFVYMMKLQEKYAEIGYLHQIFTHTWSIAMYTC